jgi:hypothetical protein
MYDPEHLDELRQVSKALKKPKRSHSFSEFVAHVDNKENQKVDLNVLNELQTPCNGLKNCNVNTGSSSIHNRGNHTFSLPELDSNFVTTKSHSLPSLSSLDERVL